MRAARMFVAVLLLATACGSDREDPGDGGSSATSAQAPAVTTEAADGQGSSGATDHPPVGASEGSSALPDGPVPDLPTEPRPTTWPAFVPAGLEWEPATILVSKEGVNEVIPVYDAPDGNRLTFPDGELWSYTYRGNRLVVRVTQGAEGDEWVEAELPIRPNGTRGWIRTDKFNWSTVNHHIFVDVSDRSMAFFDGDELITRTRVLVGTRATLIPERVGEALSNGGVRTPAEPLEIIAQQAPLGTVVRIVE